MKFICSDFRDAERLDACGQRNSVLDIPNKLIHTSKLTKKMLPVFPGIYIDHRTVLFDPCRHCIRHEMEKRTSTALTLTDKIVSYKARILLINREQNITSTLGLM